VVLFQESYLVLQAKLSKIGVKKDSLAGSKRGLLLFMIVLLKESEVKLVELASSVASETISWRAVHFPFNNLLEHYQSDYQLQIAVNLLSDLLVDYEGGVFVCFDHAIIVLCRNVSKAKMDKAIFQLRYLFMDDPLAYDANGEENSLFCRIFDIGREYAEFFQICKTKLTQSTRAEGEISLYRKPAGASLKADKESNLFTPLKLAHIEQDLNKADLSRILRRQSVCVLDGNLHARKIFDEYYIRIPHLRQMLHTKIDLLSNQSLFAYLTHILDDRVMELMLQNPLRYLDAPVSLNFNIATILSKKFTEFDTIIKNMVKHTMVIELQIGDVFTDMRAFLAARNILENLGYKLCIDGVTNLSIVQIDRERLGFDFAKFQWNSDIEEDVNAGEHQHVMRAITSFGKNRVILTRCDNAQAVRYGQAMGINLFQGRFVDRLINPAGREEN